jgi:hypothetical protein
MYQIYHLYDIASLSNVPSLSTAVLNDVINLSNLSGLVYEFLYVQAIRLPQWK